MFVICEPLTIKYSRSLIIFSYVAGITVFNTLRAYCMIYYESFPADAVFFILIMPVFSILFLRFACSDKLMKIVLFFILVYAIAVLGNILSFILYRFIYGEFIRFDFASESSLQIAIIGLFVETISYALLYFIWKRYIGSIRSDIPNIGVFLLVIGGQLIYAMTQLLDLLSNQIELSSWTSIGVIIMIVSNLAVLQILLTNSKKKEIEDNFNEIQHIRELEQMHYTSIDARRKEMAKIRHDFSNQLTAARQLFLSNKSEHTDALLKELEQSLDTATEQAYCENAIVNAVLTEKKKECHGAEITLETDIVIPENCGISQSHLCSIFTNLLDNAIRACKNLPERQRKIELRTAFKGRYLHVKCVNPMSDSPQKGKNGKGYGKIILSDIAANYNGNFTAEIANGAHTAVLSLFV